MCRENKPYTHNIYVELSEEQLQDVQKSDVSTRVTTHQSKEQKFALPRY